MVGCEGSWLNRAVVHQKAQYHGRYGCFFVMHPETRLRYELFVRACVPRALILGWTRNSFCPARTGSMTIGDACKTGGFQESKFNYFNDLQELRCILIRLSIRAGTGIEPFKTKAYTGGREIGFGGLVPIRSRWPQVLCAVGGR